MGNDLCGVWADGVMRRLSFRPPRLFSGQHHSRCHERPTQVALSVLLPPVLSFLSVLHLAAQDTAPTGGPLPDNVASQHVSISYTDPQRCLQMLQVYGYQTSEPGKALDVSALPTVMVVPSTAHHQLPDDKKKNFPQTETDPVTDLLVFYDRNHPEQLGILIDRIRRSIDVPARQIMIEALVLEIASTALDQLGVQWDLNRSALSGGNWFNKYTTGAVSFGSLALEDGAAITDPTLQITATDIFGEFQTQLQALVVSKAARVLSRPSVLTLDNRMAYINVSEKIPVAESKFSGQYFTQVSFREITAGIELTVRPRVSADGGEIGMQITAAVTARKPGEDVVINSTSSGNQVFEVARSPTISVREVRTFARIANNTPFIIGGLVAEDDTKIRRKVPVLGDIPFLGGLFRTRQDSDGRREVIIVITPHVLPDERAVAGNLPKDVDDFDSFGAELFRDAYRIRAEDVFNLRFLTDNQRLRKLQQLADQAVTMDPKLADVYPFENFHHGRIPGEEILVYRQMYEVIKRRDLESAVDEQRLIYLTADEDGVIGVGRLARTLSKLAESEPGLNALVAEISDSPRARRKAMRATGEDTKAVAYTFRERQRSAAVGEVLMQPVPEIQVLDCPDRDAWSDLMWKLNKPDPETGEQRFTIVLRDSSDIVRLRRAIVVRKTVDLNAQTRDMTLQNFAMGHILMIPTMKEEGMHLVDKEVAKYFFYTEQYYRAVGYELEKDIPALEEALTNVGITPEWNAGPDIPGSTEAQ